MHSEQSKCQKLFSEKTIGVRAEKLDVTFHKEVRQSLRLFKSYLWAITNGKLRLELRFYKTDLCTQAVNGTLAVDYIKPIRDALPPGDITKIDLLLANLLGEFA